MPNFLFGGLDVYEVSIQDHLFNFIFPQPFMGSRLFTGYGNEKGSAPPLRGTQLRSDLTAVQLWHIMPTLSQNPLFPDFFTEHVTTQNKGTFPVSFVGQN